MTNDGMVPVLTITDAPTAYVIAEALRAQADANRRVADRLCSASYESVKGSQARNASRLIAHAHKLEQLANVAERQAHAIEASEAPTQEMRRIVPVPFA